MTVRWVFETLRYAGLISRRHGKGTYVAPRVSRETGLIGYIGQSLTEGTSSELFSHLSAAQEERKSVKWHLLVCSAENSLERQVAFAATLMDRSEIPDRMETILAGGATALLGHSDFPARDALSWCSRNGVDIPGQMAIVGIGNLRHAQEPEPVKTTVRKDFKRMADLALEIMLQRMEVRRGSEWRRETIDVDLLVRSTCGAPGQADRPASPDMWLDLVRRR